MEEKNPTKGHVLIVPWPDQGHINPILQFANRLVAKGLKVTIAHTVYNSKSMHSESNSQIDIATFSNGFDDNVGVDYSSEDSTRAYLEKFQVVGIQTLTSLIERLGQTAHPVTALVYDGFLAWVLGVAKQFGIVSAMFLTQTCAVGNIYYHVHRGILPIPLSRATRVLLPGLPSLEPSETPSHVHSYGSFPTFDNFIMSQFKDVDQVDWVLVNSFYELEKEVVDCMKKLWRVRTIGPSVPSLYSEKRHRVNLFKPDSAACLTWLNSKPSDSVVYVSFGSLAQVKPDQMVEIAWGLKESGCNFLWVVRALEQSKLPEEFKKETAGQGLVVTWSPQLEVLEHDSLGCFVTHCGWNSILESLSLGVAVVAVPQLTDQPTNAKFVEDVWGIGIRAEKDEEGLVRRQALASCIREVMVGEKGRRIRENSIKWKRLAEEAVSEGGSSNANIDEFVAEIAARV